MSEEIKMTDVFGLPLVVCRSNPSMITAKPTYKGKVDYHQATLRSNHEVHVIYGAHAINVHDSNQETITKQTEEIELLREALGYSMRSLSIMTEDTIDISKRIRNLSLETLVDCDDILDEIKLLQKDGE